MITIYTIPSCTRCDELKSFMKENNIEYQEKNAMNDFRTKAKMIAKGFNVMPVIGVADQYYNGNLNYLKTVVKTAKDD